MRGTHLALKGRIKAQVIDHSGRVIRDYPEQPNLLLDQGLNQMAHRHIADLFLYSIKGTGSTITTEAVTGTYSQALTGGGNVVVRASGARDFTMADEGKLIYFSGSVHKEQAMIVTYNSATQVTVDRTQDNAIVGQTITIYSVGQLGLDAEDGSRTLSGNISKPLSGTTVTADTLSQFSAGDIGAQVYFISSDTFYPITAFIDGQNVTVDISVNDKDLSTPEPGIVYEARTSDDSACRGRTDTYSAVAGENSTTDGTGGSLGQRTLKRTFIFDPEIANEEDVTGTYTRSSGTVTRTAGTRDFTGADVGKVLAFSDGTEYTITANPGASTTVVTVTPISGPTSSTNIKLYGFQTYNEIGFSHTGAPGANANIRVKLASGAVVQSPTGINPGQQLKVTYSFLVSLSPNSSTASTPTATDSGNQMSTSKAGTVAVESLALASIGADGQTDSGIVGLEPSESGSMGISTSSAALVPMNGPDRTAGLATTDLTADAYTDGTFQNSYRGTFGLNDAIGTTWRTLMLFDVDSGTALFTHLFAASQKKDANHVLNAVWTKTWNRDLS